MKYKAFIICVLVAFLGFAQAEKIGDISVIPIEHASMVLQTSDGRTIFVDPAVKPEEFNKYGKPDIVFITDIHGDHLNTDVLKQLQLDKSIIVVPKAVSEKIANQIKGRVVVLNNGDKGKIADILIEVIPMYNLREEALNFHPRGRGNGYVLTINNKRVYISGDTEDIPEMRQLKDIDIAFVCMNLPYTMPVEKAVEAVLDFKPAVVIPYHYRGQEGKSDVNKFKQLVTEKNKNIKVKLLKWYP